LSKLSSANGPFFNERAISSVALTQENDVIILCGKGHEEYQVIGDDYMEFSEHKIIKELTKGMVE
ncbi:MAG: hypothetical protein ACI4J4_04660, partial [Ruminiclostridium sp.]